MALARQPKAKEGPTLSHSKLVRHAQKWARSRGYVVVLTEPKTNMTHEEPDVIAWKNAGQSLLVECKASRSDFLVDRKKSHRIYPQSGMGVHRYYFTPEGLLKADELPERWGLVEVIRRGMRTGFRVVAQATAQERAVQHEAALLVQACRRAVDGWGRGMFGDEAPPAADVVDGDAGPTASKIIADLRKSERKWRDSARDAERELLTLRARLLEIEGPPQPVVELDPQAIEQIHREAV